MDHIITVRFKDLTNQHDVLAGFDFEALPDPLLKDKLERTLEAHEDFTLSEHATDLDGRSDPERIHVGGFQEIEHALRRPTGEEPLLTVWLDKVVPGYFPRPRGPRV